MHEQMDSIFTLGLITFATILAYLLWRRRNDGSRRLPPGPWGVPLLGSLPYLSPDLHLSFTALAKSYGPIMSLRLGTRLCVVVSSSPLAREVLHDHDAAFASHDPPIAGFVSFRGLNIGWVPYGPHWRTIRKLVVQELLASRNLDSFQSLRAREVRRVVEELQSRAGKAVEIREMLFCAMLNIVRGMMWGATSLGEEKGRDFRVAIDGIMELWGSYNVSDFFPVLAPLDLQGVQGKMEGFCSKLDAVFDSVIDERVKNNEAEGKRERRKDFLQVMLDLVEKKDPQKPLELIHVKAMILDMIAAGTDTISMTVEWAMSELLRHPHAMAKVQQEVDAVVGSRAGGFILEESTHVPKLRYLDAVAKETMRLHPVAPLLAPYRSGSSCTVGGYTVPEGTKVFVNAWAIHRDPSSWEDPLEFRPERFLDGRSKGDYNGTSFDYLPFGSGRRVCAGVGLGGRMVTYMLGSLLHEFEWRLPERVTDVDVDGKFGLVLKKRNPLVAVPTLRSP